MPQIDEETPLLSDQIHNAPQTVKKKQRTPLPWRQFSILLLVQVSEPITSQVIAPFLPQLIRDIGVTDGEDSRVGYYVGLLHSLFFLTEACTIYHWSRISDHIGRRPVLLTGLFGLSASMWCFGLSKTFSSLVVRPAERFPRIFGNSAFLKEYPYFLPCSISTTVTVLSWFITFFFLKETTKPRMTPRQYFFGGTTKGAKPCADSLIHEVPQNDQAAEEMNKPLPFRSLLTFRAILPVYYAMPIEMGGLNLQPPTIGVILAVFGISGALLQLLFFPPMHDWLGAKNTFLVAVSLSFPMIALFPVINAVARVYGIGSFVWLLVGLQMTLLIFACFAFPISFIYISAAAPNKASIGATNGIAQMIVSLMRAIGPATVNSAFSLGIEKNIMGGYFAYWVMAAMAGLTLWVGYLLPRKLWKE
ncbi:major facilitator superfamily domain-containing protein [Chiua virens]|nr:major facilitator superfamily domain-containing protein [Chiua virens]